MLKKRLDSLINFLIPPKANINTLRLCLCFAVCFAFTNSGCLDNHRDRHVNLPPKCWDHSSNIQKYSMLNRQNTNSSFPPKNTSIFPLKNIAHRNLKLNLYNLNWNRSTGIVAYRKMYNLISIKAFLSASMQRSNKLLCLFIALFINSTYSAISIYVYKQDISQLYAAACV
jgi:hypothetical protein